MCTLIAAVAQSAEYPLIIAANRDEALNRPATGPRLWPGRIPFLAPRDEQAGGTWLGLNRSGVFVAITNRFNGPRDSARKSRGHLVTEALQHGAVEDIHRAFAALNPGDYNAFHLLYADARGNAAVTWSDGETLTQHTHGPGLHVVTERSFGAATTERVDYVRAHFPGTPDVDALKTLLAHHSDDEPFASLCIHAPAFNYGTRSSTILFLAPDLERSRLYVADASPCTSPFSDRTALLAELARA